MSKHTPGPWKVVIGEQNIGEPLVSVESAGGDVICDNETYYPKALDPCNASLIAAAPDLLEALIEVSASLAWNAHGECRGINDGPIMPSQMAIDTAKKAIAKARGEP